MGIYHEALKKAQGRGDFSQGRMHRGNPFQAGRHLETSRTGVSSIRLTLPRGLLNDISQLHERVAYVKPKAASRIIAFCGSDGREGASTIACTLALYTAQNSMAYVANGHNGHPQAAASRSLSRPTLIIDANLHQPSVHWRLEVPQKPGLVEIIENNLEFAEATLWLVPDGLAVIPAGRYSRSVAEIFKSHRMQALLRRAREVFGTIILDCAAINRHPDILPLSGELDGVILVAQSGATPLEALQRAKKTLNEHSIPILGVVLNRHREYLPRTLRQRV